MHKTVNFQSIFFKLTLPEFPRSARHSTLKCRSGRESSDPGSSAFRSSARLRDRIIRSLSSFSILVFSEALSLALTCRPPCIFDYIFDCPYSYLSLRCALARFNTFLSITIFIYLFPFRHALTRSGAFEYPYSYLAFR